MPVMPVTTRALVGGGFNDVERCGGHGVADGLFKSMGSMMDAGQGPRHAVGDWTAK